MAEPRKVYAIHLANFDQKFALGRGQFLPIDSQLDCFHCNVILVLVRSLDLHEVEFDSSFKIRSEFIDGRLHRHRCRIAKRAKTLPEYFVSEIIKKLDIAFFTLE